MASYYLMACWYKQVFFLFDMAIANAWAIHHALGGEESQKASRVGLASDLMGEFRKGTARCSKADSTAATACHHQNPDARWRSYCS